jgi:hypothetical protein
VVKVTIFDDRQCHKWALLLQQRRQKIFQLQTKIANKDFSAAKGLFQEIFYGVPKGKAAEPGWWVRCVITWLWLLRWNRNPNPSKRTQHRGT